ncbi:hypothetical protein M3598_25460 [Cytobacillus oceanisediminis]|uniref:hypothetical protein n=1 Tax=Cytobacillus oceanisediminis TaxID=665099 RepID=UPI00203DDD4B|nr:hypothetical protein [Cytobacillus oceanisediminis]MCM3246082.1 hypothetical protein [Cytobacillus oceanisediminis]
MPDWSYRTIFRPLLFNLPAELSRDLTLQTFGLLGKLPFGSFIIRTMGHMEMSPILQGKLDNVHIKYPVGLSGGIDPHVKAHKAISEIGFGFMEVGPVTLNKINCEQPILRDKEKEAIIYPDSYANDGVDKVLERLKAEGAKLPLMFRLRHSSGSNSKEVFEEICTLSEKVSGYASGYYLDILDDLRSMDETITLCRRLIHFFRSRQEKKPVFLYIPLDLPSYELTALLHSTPLKGFSGFVIGDSIQTSRGQEVGKAGKNFSIEKIAFIRKHCGKEKTVIASSGVHEPLDALDLIETGADFIQLHSGLVYSGPGLPKRVNEAILYDRSRSNEPEAALSFWRYWGWMCLLGIGMIVGGIIAWIIALTSVLLPYDEAFLGMQTDEIKDIYPQLIEFMSHDRTTLAGTMISIGILYFILGRFGLRYELHWAKTALLASGIVGFISFFLYLGHGYFDPLHALAAVLLLPMFILAMRSKGNQTLKGQPNLVNDRNWLLAQWGQLMFVILGIAFAIGGLTISYVGITDVFVKEDLCYLQIPTDQLIQTNKRLLSLIAHDRAGFGGALFSNSIALLATALWGIQQGKRWIWWMFLLGGFPGFFGAFSVHWMIGYNDFIHLLPAYFAVALYAAGLVLLFPYLMGDPKIIEYKSSLLHRAENI